MSTPTPERATDRDAVKKTKLENANLRVGILVAVVTLLIPVAGFLGIKLNDTSAQKQAAQGAVQTLQIVLSTQGSALTQNSAELQSAQSAISSLQAQNSVLSSRIAASTSTPTVPTPAPSPATNETNVRHTGTVVLTLNQNGADLDAPAEDATWGTLQSNGIDLQYFLGRLAPSGSSKILILGTAQADYATCSTRTGYGGMPVEVEKDAYACIFTGERRFVAAQVTDVNEQSATLAATSYDTI